MEIRVYVFDIDDNTESLYLLTVQLKIVITITQVAFAFSEFAICFSLKKKSLKEVWGEK